MIIDEIVNVQSTLTDIFNYEMAFWQLVGL